MAKDLVCGMNGDFKIKSGYGNKDYYFCSDCDVVELNNCCK